MEKYAEERIEIIMKKKIKGVGLCLAIALPSYILVKLIPTLSVIGAPVIAILAGMVIAFIFTKRETDTSVFKAGITFTSKKILQTAVVLLGFGLNLSTIGKVGATSIPIIISTIATSLIISFIMYKALKMHKNSAVLIGVGSSICGGSAIAATAPVIGADDEEIAQSISVIFLFNVIAALIFPTLGGMLGMSNEGFGLFAGTAVNDTSSVTAAAATWDVMHNTGGTVLEYATIVKLTRTLAIIPITLVLALYQMRIQKDKMNFSFRRAFPMFILYFLLASVVTTILTSVLTGGALTAANEFFSLMKELSKFFIVMAMSAIGLNTDIVKLVKSGGKPILLGFVCWTCITLVSICMQHFQGLM